MTQKDPSPPVCRVWFPYIKLSLFLIVFVLGMSALLNLFDPHIERDPKEWENQPTKKVKQIEWMLKFMKPKDKK